MITITVDDTDVMAALERLRLRSSNLQPALASLGEHLAETTKRRFDTSTSPDGGRWAPNAKSTILAHLGIYSSSFSKKTGKITASGAGRAMIKKPLIGETRSLMSTINYRVGDGFVEIGSPMKYAAVQQFGASKHQFGKSPWGNIPARPFLGVSNDDRQSILDIITEHLSAP